MPVIFAHQLTSTGTQQGLVLNRIHHLVRRPHVHRPDQQPNRRNIPGLFLLPFANLLASPAAANALRLPGVVALCQAWLLLSVVLAQVTGWWDVVPTFLDFALIHRLGHWADQMPMSDVCWNIYLSVCLCLASNNIARGLERRCVASIADIVILADALIAL